MGQTEFLALYIVHYRSIIIEVSSPLSKTAFLAVAPLHPLEASASVVHNGAYFPSLSCQPHSKGLGIAGFVVRDPPQIWPACTLNMLK